MQSTSPYWEAYPSSCRVSASTAHAALLFIACLGFPGIASAQISTESLDALIEQAREENALNVTVQSSWDRAILADLGDAFKERFGLDLELTITPTQAARQMPIEIAATSAGAPPTFDAIQGDDSETMLLIGAGGVQTIENWETLLTEINELVASGEVQPEEISRGPFTGQSFLFMSNIKQIIYNPELITEDELPRTHEDLADPRYQGRFIQPPWTSHWEIAPLVFDPDRRDEWLEVVRAAGQNGTVLSEAEGTQRVVLGQYDFVLGQDAYYRQTLAQDAEAPIAFRFFEDYNELNGVYYSVRTRTSAPAAATLWVLWMTTPEAQELWQPSNMSFQPYGRSEIDIATNAAIAEYGAPVIGFLDNDETAALLEWKASPEGAEYLGRMARAIQGE